MPLLHAIVHARRTKDGKYVMHQVSTAARAYSSISGVTLVTLVTLYCSLVMLLDQKERF